MYVRLAFATAISIDPEILIVDEALAVGDIFFQQKCIAHMKEMTSKATILFVTHDMQSVSNLCERVILLNDGKISYDGDPKDAVSNYTKLVHNERFQQKRNKSISNAPSSDKNDIRERYDAEDNWIIVSEEDRGGTLEIEILRIRVIDKKGDTKEAVVKGETLTVQIVLLSKRDIDTIIIGYTIKDRIGNSIFGENTRSSLAEDFSVPKGESVVSFEFDWPEVYPETYTITVGIGEGTDPFVHKIHCWAHNIVSFTALSPDKGVHGIFNNAVKSCIIRPVP